ncbi:MAG: HDIG domain-containing protein, partial [Deltaproteobacteria bacterium]|nr:HDIG domain-containing protein [Deltaproteobacteria bacterium]
MMEKNKKAKVTRTNRTPRRTDRESQINAKRPRQGWLWFGDEARKWYILAGLSLILAILLFPNVLTLSKSYELGDVADVDVKASRHFLVENKDLTEENRQDAVRKVLFVYDFDHTGTNTVSRIREAFRLGREYAANALAATHSPESPSTPEKKAENAPTAIFSIREQFFEILDIAPDEPVFERLLQNGFSSEAETLTVKWVTRIFSAGVVGNKAMLMDQSVKGIVLHDLRTMKDKKINELNRFQDVDEAREFILGQGRVLAESAEEPGYLTISAHLAAALIKPNVTFNNRETELRKELARNSVTPFYFKVKKGEMLVREGERITTEHLLKLREHSKFHKRKEVLSRVPAMALVIGFLISAMYLVGLMSRRSRGSELRDMIFNALTLLTIFLVVMAAHFISEEMARGFPYFTPMALAFAIPVASGAMLTAVFHGVRVAATFSLISSVLASLVVGGGTELFVYFFTGSLVAAHGVRSCRERGVLIKAGLKVSLVSAVLALSIVALHGSLYTMEALIAFASALLGGILAGILTTGILPLVEMTFGYTTDIKLLELANLDKPLLRELMVRCPGTHHHSVIVSNMVEASAAAIKANPLLAKVAAYYHDIGKMKKPLYFIENQRNRENKHEKLAPSMSSLILISHVKDGAELARESKLGQEIIDIIQQHHGTSLISYFYEKAREQAEKSGGKLSQAGDQAYRYPGPKPQTKEAGLVMLADVVEAASRTLVDPTAARIQGLVQRIVNRVFSDGQLDECELTLKDLHEIAKSFNQTLSG